MKLIKFINLKVLGLLAVMAVVVFFGYLSWQNYQLKLERQKFEMSVKTQELEAKKIKDKETEEAKLDKQMDESLCLSEAEDTFDSNFELNSTDNGDGSREWDSMEIKKVTEGQYNKDRDICLRRY